MLVRPAAPVFVAAALFASLLVAGCSGDSGGGAAGATAERAYYGCLEEHGVVLEKRDDGVLRVDKDKNISATQTAAEAKCADLLPGDVSASPAPAAFVAKAKNSACVRKNGFPEYPDPDPVTGEVEPAADKAATYRTPAFQAAAAACSPAADGDIASG